MPSCVACVSSRSETFRNSTLRWRRAVREDASPIQVRDARGVGELLRRPGLRDRVLSVYRFPETARARRATRPAARPATREYPGVSRRFHAGRARSTDENQDLRTLGNVRRPEGWSSPGAPGPRPRPPAPPAPAPRRSWAATPAPPRRATVRSRAPGPAPQLFAATRPWLVHPWWRQKG